MISQKKLVAMHALSVVCAASMFAAIPAAAWADASGLNQVQTEAANQVQATEQEDSSLQDSSTDDSSSQPSTDQDDQSSVYKYSVKILMLKGTSQSDKYGKEYGTVKGASSNKKIVKVSQTGKNKFKIKALKNGSAKLTFTSDKLSVTYKVTVSSGSAYVNKWASNAANEIKSWTSEPKEQLVAASRLLVGGFTYANVYDLEKVIFKQKGNCYSAGQVLVKICKKLGYKAKLRYAVNDNMSRYPAGISFGSNHYNVKVTAKGKAYFIDATPGMGFAYLSNSKKPLMEYMQISKGVWMRVL